MTQNRTIICGKMDVLDLAQQRGAVSQACKMIGFSCDGVYRCKDLSDPKGG